MYKNYKLLKHPSPVDANDYHISAFAGKPKSYPEEMWIKTCAKVKDQGDTSTCVGHSLSTVKEAIEWVQRLKLLLGIPDTVTDFYDILMAIEDMLKNKQNIDISSTEIVFSPGFNYANRDVLDSQDEGMIPRQALKNLKRDGAVPYNLFPFLGDYPTLKAKFETNKVALLEAAKPYRITGYCRLRTVEEIKTALMKLGPVTICVPVYNSLCNVNPDGIIKLPDFNKEALEGYHEITIMGYKRDYRWVTQNSWSEDWGYKGFGFLPFNYPIAEAWSITDTIMPEMMTPLVPVPPSPQPQPKNEINTLTLISMVLKNVIGVLQELLTTVEQKARG